MRKDSRIYCQQGPLTITETGCGCLSGMTFVFKDLFDVEGYKTGAGNPVWLSTHEEAKSTSPLIEKLLQQGAFCCGRVQSDELAYSLNGQNIHYGTPINPAAPECIPGGSSSGSAVAVANGDSDVSIGTDTGGSVRVPASYCGLFGLRPTLGGLDLSNCFELAKSFDTAGIFTRDLASMSKVWSTLSSTEFEGKKANVVYLDNQCAQVLTQERSSRLHQWCKQADISLIHGDFLADNGWSLEELSLLFRTIQGFEIIEKHGSWLELNGRSLDPAIMARVIWAKSITREQYVQAQKKQSDFKKVLNRQMKQLGSLWIIPTTPSGPPSLDQTEEELAEYRSHLMGLTSIAGLSGLPQLHLPMKALNEGPCGVSVLGGANSENSLIVTGEALIEGESE
ncbi:amidase [Vibrio sp. RC27]